MTALELWCFVCICCTFGSLLSYIIILFKLECSNKVIHLEDSKYDRRKTVHLELGLFLVVFTSFVIFNIWIVRSMAVKTRNARSQNEYYMLIYFDFLIKSWSQQRMNVNGIKMTVVEDQCETNKNFPANRGKTKALDSAHSCRNQTS